MLPSSIGGKDTHIHTQMESFLVHKHSWSFTVFGTGFRKIALIRRPGEKKTQTGLGGLKSQTQIQNSDRTYHLILLINVSKGLSLTCSFSSVNNCF